MTGRGKKKPQPRDTDQAVFPGLGLKCELVEKKTKFDVFLVVGTNIPPGDDQKKKP